MAQRVVDNGGVYLPALSGLGAPHWDMTARELFGITGEQQEHLVRVVLEAIAYQVKEVVR